MALYHLSVKTVSRSTGRSAVAAAAYRTGTLLTNGITGDVHDYRPRRRTVEEAFIVAPPEAEWARDRAALWTTAERKETRRNSVVAREYELALLAELDASRRRDLAREFAETLVARFGVAADVALHKPGREGDQRNHHAHVLTTTRRAGGDGLGAKTRPLDERTSGAIVALRETWAGQVNCALERVGSDARVDHRSHAKRGFLEEPGIHLGAASAMERRAVREHRKEAGPDAAAPAPVTERGRQLARIGEGNGAIQRARAEARRSARRLHQIEQEARLGRARGRLRPVPSLSAEDREALATVAAGGRLESVGRRMDLVPAILAARVRQGREGVAALAEKQERRGGHWGTVAGWSGDLQRWAATWIDATRYVPSYDSPELEKSRLNRLWKKAYGAEVVEAVKKATRLWRCVDFRSAHAWADTQRMMTEADYQALERGPFAAAMPAPPAPAPATPQPRPRRPDELSHVEQMIARRRDNERRIAALDAAAAARKAAEEAKRHLLAEDTRQRNDERDRHDRQWDQVERDAQRRSDKYLREREAEKARLWSGRPTGVAASPGPSQPADAATADQKRAAAVAAAAAAARPSVKPEGARVA